MTVKLQYNSCIERRKCTSERRKAAHCEAKRHKCQFPLLSTRLIHRTKGRWFYRGEGGRTRTVAQVHIYSHTIHKYSHTIRTLFATIRTLFAHYSRTIRALFAPVHIGSRRFTPVRAGSRKFKPGSHSIRLCSHYLRYSQVFTLFARYSHYSRSIRKYSRGIRTVFAQYSRTFAHVRTSVADRSHSIRNYSQPFTPSRIGKHL